MDKFIVDIEGVELPLGVRFDNRPGKNILTVGGNSKVQLQIEQVLSEYFSVDPLGNKVKCEWPQRNKIRYKVKLDRKTYVGGLKKLREHFEVKDTSTFERLFR